MRTLKTYPEVTPIDTYIADMKKQLSRLEFEDPEFDVVSKELTQAYIDIANGEAFYVPF
jgi:hypothetical protein